MTLADGLALIISSLAAIVTITGWSVVYRQQRQIMENQAELSEAKEKKDTRLKIILSEIESVYSWLNEGHDLVILSGIQDANSLRPRLLDWQLKYNKEVESSHLFDYNVQRPGFTLKGEEVRQEVLDFHKYVITVVNARADGDQTKALELLTDGEYKTYDKEIVESNFDGFKILLPDHFWDIYVGPRIFLEGLRNALLK